MYYISSKIFLREKISERSPNNYSNKENSFFKPE